jgi:PAS domain S-box-containing protein
MSHAIQPKNPTGELSWERVFLEALVNSARDGMLVVDAQGRQTFQNQRFVELLRMPRPLADKRDDGKQLKWFLNTIKNPGPFMERVEYLYSHPNETSRDVIELKDGTTLDRHSSPVVGKDGKYYGRIWTFRDITERRQTEETLASEQRMLNSLITALPDLVYFKDQESRFIRVNEAYARRNGFGDPSAVLGKTDFDLFGREHASQALADEQRIMAAGQPMIDKEEREDWKDGRVTWVSTTKMPMRDSAGRIIGIMGISRDITERKLAEERLQQSEEASRESQERFSSAFEYAPVGMALVSLDGRWLQVNRALCDLLGYSEAELLARTFQDITHPDDLEASLDNIRKLLAGAIRSYHLEKRYVHARGTAVTALLNVSLVRDAEGQPRHFIAQIQDLTEQRRLEAQLFQSQKMETVGRLAGGIAHEFNSLMTTVIGQSELVLGDLPPESPLRKNAAEIRQAADRAAGLTRQLLAYGRRQFLQLEFLDLNRVLAGMEGMLRHLVGAGVAVEIVPAAGLRPVKADAGQMEQVIVNMVMNAREAMPGGGKLVLETSNVTVHQESLGLVSELKPGDYVMLAITDNGAGMSDEVKKRVFEPFFTTKDVGKGTGLGLATCHGIIEQSGGHISVHSKLGEGTTFQIFLPRVEPE